MRRLMATSFSTPRSSKVCGVKASLRNVLLQIGQGAGPNVKSRSIHDSHLLIYFSVMSGYADKALTFCDSMNLRVIVALGSNTDLTCIQDIGRPWTAGRSVICH